MVDLDLNSCRICLSIPQANERQDLLIGERVLSDVGLLYEEVLSLNICFEGVLLKYICNSCDLQLKLFKQLKSRALETLLLLSDMCHLSESESIALNSFPPEYVHDIEIKQIERYEDIVPDTSLKSNESIQVDRKENAIEYLDQDIIIEDFGEMQDEEYLLEFDDLKTEQTNCSEQVYGYECPTCCKTFSFKKDLMNHNQRMHPKANKFRCSICPKRMYSEEALKKHLNIHRGLPAYQCNLCEKTFKQKTHYNYHLLHHKNERNIICDVCQKGFLSKSDLKIHKRMHTDERLYQCDICAKKFRAHTHVVNHRYSHFEKQFECPLCFQKYVSPNTLRYHLKTVHTSDVPFECEFCEKKFKRKHHLHAHYKTHSKVSEKVVAENEKFTLDFTQ